MAKKKEATKKVAKKVTAKNVVSDYNGYDYKKEFWEDTDRAYEDAADRMAIRRLLPERTDKFVDIAGGYGRLAPEYIDRAQHPILFDYSQTELDQAKQEYGNKLKTVQGDIYHLPFEDNSISDLMMVRATHHFKDMPAVLKELNRVLEPGGTAVIEFANKKTLPKMARFVLKRSKINPFSKEPSNDTALNPDGFFNYHPKYIKQIIKDADFMVIEKLSVSNFRSPRLKKMFGTKFLTALEKKVQKPLAAVNFAPSLYYKLRKPEHIENYETVSNHKI